MPAEQNCTLLKKCRFNTETQLMEDRRDDAVAKASASQSVDLGFIFQVESFQKTLKNSIHSFPTWRSAKKRDRVENTPASSLVVPLGKALNGMPQFLWQTAGVPVLYRVTL